MKLGIDLDGVVADWHKGVADVVNSIWPGRIPVGSEYPPEWELTSLGLSQSELGVVFDKVSKTLNWYMGLPALPRNVHAVWSHRIRHPEDEIFYVTARTTETKGLPIMHQSQRWLEMCGIGGVGTAVIVVPDDVKKIDVYESIGVQYAVDDAPHIVAEGTHVITLLDRPWNQDRSKWVDVVADLDEFFKQTRRQS